MKKIVFFLMLAVALASCKGDDGIDGRDGRDGVDGKNGEGTNWHTTAVTVKEADWILEGGKPNETGTNYYAKVDVKELTQWVYDEGTVLAYYSPDKGVKVGLPYIRLQGFDEEETGNQYTWTETIDFEFKTGEIYLYVNSSDFITENPPQTMTFHIVLMW